MNIRRRIVKITAAATLSAAALGIVSTAPAGAVAGDPSQWGQVAVAGDPSQWGRDQAVAARAEAEARKVNEYEGQHRKVNEYEGQH